MTGKHTPQQYDIGMVGLGVMGCNLVLNMADHGFWVAGYDKDQTQVEALRQKAVNTKVRSVTNMEEFVGLLRRPRAIMMLVPAGAPVDSVIDELLVFLQPGDIIIDGGNSYFKDTNVRANNLAKKGILFLGVGISGGEEGARLGPSIMPGGPKEAYERVRPIFEAIAAKVDRHPCVSWLGPGSTGHFVKMVHNGIEYGIMQLLAEAYDLMKRGLGLNDDELHEIFSLWAQGELGSYLIDITAHIFSVKDQTTGKRLIDEIRDIAKQKGTGLWTSQSAMELQVPTPTIDLAVSMRDLSVLASERQQANVMYPKPVGHSQFDRDIFLAQLHSALYAAMTITYSQGLALLAAASEKYKYYLDLETISRIWQGGCIIRSALLVDICAAFRVKKNLSNVLLDPSLSHKLTAHQEGLRQVVCWAAMSEIPIPALMTSLGYLDAFKSAWLPANLIQAQRDYFGAHTYERIDSKGAFHTDWEKE